MVSPWLAAPVYAYGALMRRWAERAERKAAFRASRLRDPETPPRRNPSPVRIPVRIPVRDASRDPCRNPRRDPVRDPSRNAIDALSPYPATLCTAGILGAIHVITLAAFAWGVWAMCLSEPGCCSLPFRTPPPVPQAPCPPPMCRWPWVGFGSFCFLYNETKMTRSDASRQCYSVGAELCPLIWDEEISFLTRGTFDGAFVGRVRRNASRPWGLETGEWDIPRLNVSDVGSVYVKGDWFAATANEYERRAFVCCQTPYHAGLPVPRA
ncbi:b161 [miniopterid betaherpesvirus 1]|uniref:B161 n=1 Tax=miniopterid betaherpesvirus 1 TaxID=3070189 RepID=I3VQG3_9BETA|nr:b161 [miniopterid betaherpesvirus 1]AFK84007.1 b161 [miniopterid betaherpesvirus 1]